MEEISDMKVLFMIVNAGFSEEIIEIVNAAGIKGATIVNARGEGTHHSSFLGITTNTEKEIIFCVAEEKTAVKAMAAVHEKAGVKTPAHSICFIMPVERTLGIIK